MKQVFKSYISLSRRERMSFASLTILLLLLIAGYSAMSLFVHPPTVNDFENKKLQAQWVAFKAGHGQDQDLDPLTVESSSATLFPFDPNTLDSIGFRKLGLSARVVKGLLNWRSHGKHFYRPEDLKPLYNLTPEEYVRVAPYVNIADTRNGKSPFEKSDWGNNHPSIPAMVDINTTDVISLDIAIRGIGPVLARKIIARRDALGGYLKFEQITDGLRLPDSTLAALREKVRIDPSHVHRIALNTATVEQLSSNPFIGDKLAKGIIQLRGGYGKYSNIEQLKQVPLMTDEIYRKIAPYFTLE